MRVPRRTMVWAAILGGTTALACSSAPPEPASPGPVSSGETFFGLCDASTGVSLDTDRFAVASDEDNVVRIYRAEGGGRPVWELDLSRFLEVDRSSPETDLEGCARIGERIYWITSHGRNRRGRDRPSRRRFFATDLVVSANSIELRPVGIPYASLLADLLADPRLSGFNLARAAELAPKEPGGLNIEGLCAGDRGQLLLGFRSPIPGGRALVVPLLNPDRVVLGERARLGDPILLELGGRGVREIVPWRRGFLIVAGPVGDQGQLALFRWGGDAEPPRELHGIGLGGLVPEAAIVFAGSGSEKILLLSDDGTRPIGGTRCKDLREAGKRRFRSLWVSP